MFSKGQLLFGVMFAIAFIIALFFMYRKDSKIHQKYYKGNRWVLLAFIAFIGMIVAIKFLLG